MRRRNLVVGIGAVALAWPRVARAQKTRRVGVLMGYSDGDPEAKAMLEHFTKGLAELGWSEGRNLRLDIRWAPGKTELIRAAAKELVSLEPDLILTNSTPVTTAVRRETSTIPIVFAVVSDPVGSGFVASLSRPGGNVTGFGSLQESMASKWLELLTGVAPSVKRAAMMFNPDTAPYMQAFMLPPFEAAARALNVAPIAAPVHSDADIDRVILALGHESGGGLFGMPDNFVEIHRALIIKLAAQHNVPAVYQTPVIARDGGLLSYGADFSDIFYRSARYVDSILRGANPAELPVQLPTKYFMVVNVATAKALGLTVPSWILLSADEVIE